MSYLVFARKYRPKNFDEIMGQSHITTTLKNAIEHSRVAHAYLFSGPRGVGKTTTARILAKALNCEKGPTPKPCNKCASCQEITSGSSLDILEIDGASNRGIDDIRSLRENIKFAPSKGAFRVYIIDEVHMLSNEAFNALLKTLEEPPPHAKFIFATTNAYKVPMTILSRCQRFDFRRIPSTDIVDNLKSIIKEEGLKVDDEALGLIAKHSDGSLRDAQVVLDQIVSFAEGAINVSDVSKILGIIDDEMLFGLSGAIHNKDPKAVLKMVDTIVSEGKDVMQAAQGLIEHFRDISVAKVSDDLKSLIDAGSDKIERYRLESAKFSIEDILYIIASLSNAADLMRKTDMARIPFEAALVKLALNSGMIPIADIMKRIEALEGKGLLRPAPCGAGLAMTEFALEGKGLPARLPETPHLAGGLRPSVKAQDEVPSEVEGPRPVPNGTGLAMTTLAPAANADVLAAPPANGEKKAAAVSAERANQGQQTLSLDRILSSWDGVINYIKAKKISIASYLLEGDPVALEGGVLTIGFAKEFQFHKEVLDTIDNKKIITSAIKETFGSELKVVLVVMESAAANDRVLSQDGQEAQGQGASAGAEGAEPIVKKAIEMFSGRVIGTPNGKGRSL